jgi:hypothetical protein
MKIPKTIPIAGHTIEVKFEKNVTEDCEAYGYFNSNRRVIVIDADIDTDMKEETFWHEVIEALNYFTESEMDHHFIQMYGLFLHQIISSMILEKDADLSKVSKKISAHPKRKIRRLLRKK